MDGRIGLKHTITSTFGRLLPLLALAVGCAPNASHVASAERPLYVALTAKDAVTSYISRLVDERQQIVATEVLPDQAIDSVRVDLTGRQRLVLVEVPPDHVEPLPGELKRWGGLAAALLPDAEDLHAIGGDPRVYGLEVQGQDHRHPKSPRHWRHLDSGLGALRQHDDAAEVHAGTSAVPLIDRAFLEDRVRHLSGAAPTALASGLATVIRERRSEAGRSQARAYLRREYEALGYTVTEKAYGGSNLVGKANFIAERRAKDASKTLIIASHLDSVGNAGADDNAAGTISALAVARALQGRTPRLNLRFIAFDQEELGLLGSAAYVEQLQAESGLDEVAGVINLEMTAYNSAGDGAFHAIDCNENSSADLSAPFKRLAEADPGLGLVWRSACTSRSDHASFWDAGKPAIVVSQNFFGGDANPCYHKSCDQVDRMNFDYMQRLTTLLARVVVELAVD